MKKEWLIHTNRRKLLVFCVGWGMDSEPFRPIPSYDYDILIFYDYSETEEKHYILSLFQGYEEVVLLCWSMGVLYGQLKFRKNEDIFTRCIAVNGTLRPIDDDYGIPETIFKATLDNMNNKSLEKFYQRMCRPGSILPKFLENRPRRSLRDQLNELTTIYHTGNTAKKEHSIFSHVVISSKDLVIPTVNQLSFWGNTPSTILKGPHFPFYDFPSWDDFIRQV